MTLAGGTVADVYTGTWIEANVFVEDGRIVYVGPREPAGEVIDVSGKVIAPGYIEPHTHPWCLYSPASLLEVAVPDGTTTLVYDNLFFFLAHGVDGLRSIVDAMHAAPAHIRWVARISPQSAYADEAERFAIERIAPMLSWPEVVASGEITNWMSVARGDERVAAGIAAAKPARRRVEGHNAGASFNRLNELSAAGISSDHEAITGAEALSRLRLGMWTMLRQSSLRPDLEAMLRDLLAGDRFEPPADVHDRRRGPELLRRARHDRRLPADRDRGRRGPDAGAADGDDRPGDVPRARRGARRRRARAPRDAGRAARDRRVATGARARRRRGGRARRRARPGRSRRSTGPPGRRWSRRRPRPSRR